MKPGMDLSSRKLEARRHGGRKETVSLGRKRKEVDDRNREPQQRRPREAEHGNF